MRRHADLWSAAVLLGPTLLILGVFSLYPAAYSLFLSFVEWDGFSPVRRWVGLGHYERLLRSSEFWSSLRVTVAYSAAVTALSVGLGVLAAALLEAPLRGRTLYRALYFLPVVTPTIAVGVVWKHLYDPSQGIVNRLIALTGVEGPSWLTDPSWALAAVVVVGAWKRVGFNTAIYLAALTQIPRALKEAAAIDGASSWTRFREVTWPLLAPATFFVVVTGIIEAFQVFDLVYVMTNGGPLGATDVLPFYLYRQGFVYSRLGYASAVAYAIFTIVFGLTLLQYRFLPGGARDEA